MTLGSPLCDAPRAVRACGPHTRLALGAAAPGGCSRGLRAKRSAELRLSALAPRRAAAAMGYYDLDAILAEEEVRRGGAARPAALRGRMFAYSF